MTYQEQLKQAIANITNAYRSINRMVDETDPDYKKHIYAANGALMDAETALQKLHNALPYKTLSKVYNENS